MNLAGYRYRPENVRFMQITIAFKNPRLRERGVNWLLGYGATAIVERDELEIMAVIEDTSEMSRDLNRLPGVNRIELFQVMD